MSNHQVYASVQNEDVGWFETCHDLKKELQSLSNRFSEL